MFYLLYCVSQSLQNISVKTTNVSRRLAIMLRMLILVSVVTFYTLGRSDGHILKLGKRGCKGDRNAVFRRCRSCEGTCDTHRPACIDVCLPAGCQCKTGYVRFNNKCILPKQCPDMGCGGDPNAKYATPCYGADATCDEPNPISVDICGQGTCQCKKGFVLHNGKCILLEHCPIDG